MVFRWQCQRVKCVNPSSLQLLEVYDCTREELRIGPFSYDPIRAVDLWLQQPDEFLIQNLSSVPEVSVSPRGCQRSKKVSRN